MSDYYLKYLKYKTKYLELKKLLGGRVDPEDRKDRYYRNDNEQPPTKPPSEKHETKQQILESKKKEKSDAEKRKNISANKLVQKCSSAPMCFVATMLFNG